MAQSDLPIGIFAKTFSGTTADTVLGAVAATGIRHAQFNLSCLGLHTVPDTIPLGAAKEIRDAQRHHSVSISALSGTCNLDDPDQAVRSEWVRRLANLAILCASARIPVLTLTTGTRHPTDLWAAHPDNTTPAAWADARSSLAHLIRQTRGLRVTFAFEPEPSSITRSVADAVRMLDELANVHPWPRVGVVFDAANLVDPSDPDSLPRLLRDDVPKLRQRIALMHAKDRAADGCVVPPGQGVIDFAACIRAARGAAYDGPAIMHGLEPADVPAALAAMTRASRVA